LEVVELHEHIAQAIPDRDPDVAREAMEQHFSFAVGSLVCTPPKTLPIEAPNPVEAIRFRMVQ